MTLGKVPHGTLSEGGMGFLLAQNAFVRIVLAAIFIVAIPQAGHAKDHHNDRGLIHFYCSTNIKKPPRGKPNPPRPFNFESVEVTFQEVSVYSKINMIVYVPGWAY
jgi:hypothetical protein